LFAVLSERVRFLFLVSFFGLDADAARAVDTTRARAERLSPDADETSGVLGAGARAGAAVRMSSSSTSEGEEGGWGVKYAEKESMVAEQDGEVPVASRRAQIFPEAAFGISRPLLSPVRSLTQAPRHGCLPPAVAAGLDVERTTRRLCVCDHLAVCNAVLDAQRVLFALRPYPRMEASTSKTAQPYRAPVSAGRHSL
jgi:hypothetical protein